MRAFYPAILALGLCVPPALAQEKPDSRVLTMNGHGETNAAPDAAEVSAGVRVEAPTAQAALASANSRMAAMLASLRKEGVADQAIQTRDFSVAPQYASVAGQAPQMTGYQVSNEVDLRLDDIAKLGSVLDALVAAGANEINGVRFSFRDPAGLLASARKQAVADAEAKARTYAQAAGVTLGPLLSLRENGGGAPPRPLFAQVRASVPIAPGEQRVTADVTMTWEIK